MKDVNIDDERADICEGQTESLEITVALQRIEGKKLACITVSPWLIRALHIVSRHVYAHSECFLILCTGLH